MEFQQVIDRIWSLDGILVDKNKDGVIDGVSLYVQLDQEFFPSGLIDFFARVGYETTALSFDFFEKNKQKYTLRFIEDDETYMEMNESEIIIYYSSEESVNTLLANISRHEITRKENSLVPEIHSLGDIWNVSGFGYSNEASPYREMSLGINLDQIELTDQIGMSICNFVARASLLSTQFILPIAEKDRASIQLHIKEDKVSCVQLNEKNIIHIQGTIEQLPAIILNLAKEKHWSEGGNFGYWEQRLKKPIRNEKAILKRQWTGKSEVEKVEEIIKNNIHAADEFDIYLSRSTAVRAQLKESWSQQYGITIRNIYASFKTAFYWFEEELIPTYSDQSFDQILISVAKENNKQGLELPIRWIQEIYPVDLLIEKEWKIPKECVRFACEQEQEDTYIVYGEKEGEKKVLGTLNVPTMKINYVDGEKYAYPSTSAVIMRMKDGSIKREHIQTDRYSFYKFYVENVLPQVKEIVNDYQPGQGHTRPFFDRMEIDVWMNEDERKLGLDEERISSLEALHEDLYFNTLDYFAHWGEEIEGKSFDAPGGIVPLMHVSEEDRPRAEITLYDWEDVELPLIRTTQLTFDQSNHISEVLVEKNGEVITEQVGTHTIETNHIHPDVQRYLADDPFPTIIPDYSYRGAQIPAFECYLPTNEQFSSPIKMTMQKRTIIIEAGHHANEVSSTPAVIQLLDGIHENLLKKMNVIVIPLANVDGYQLLTRLMEEHPEWKHHAARYNAVGLEHSYVKFTQSVFGEGNVLPNLLRRWAADVIVDDHGIPSHEWVQPFAGYNSPPRFPVSYFLPSAKMYGIVRLPSSHDDPILQDNFDAIRNVVNNEIGKTDITEMNDYWRSRYQKYGNDWLPEVFLIEHADNLNFYVHEVEKSRHTQNAIGRYPEWVAADVITEAADEIVYEDVLESCVRAQVVFNTALIEQLAQTETEYIDSNRKIRKRPVQLTHYLSEY